MIKVLILLIHLQIRILNEEVYLFQFFFQHLQD